MYKFDSEIDTKNREKIKEIVGKYFSLNEESVERFNRALDEPFIDETLKPYLDNSLRYKKELSFYELQYFDESWKDFKKIFMPFVISKNLSYRNYINGKITINKNEIKLLKALTKYYIDDAELMYNFYIDNYNYMESEDFLIQYKKLSKEKKVDLIENIYNKITASKFPKISKFYLVITTNFADYFLSATGDSWNSCLSLTSHWNGVYWAGLPGLAIDKNRFMIYLTSGEKKTVFGITVDKMYYRSFGIIDKKDNLKYVKWYPSQIVKEKNIVIDSFPQISYINSSFIGSKYSINLLKYKNGLSCYIFQDNTTFSGNKHNSYLIYDEKGMKTFLEDGELHFGTIFNLHNSEGLSTLLERSKELIDYDNSNNMLYCYHCDGELLRDEALFFDGTPYCESCYNELFFTCEECGDVYSVNDLYVLENGSEVCYNCYENEEDNNEEQSHTHPEIIMTTVDTTSGTNNNYYQYDAFSHWTPVFTTSIGIDTTQLTESPIEDND